MSANRSDEKEPGLGRAWLEAIKTLHVDPKAKVKCPRCGAADLDVFDTPPENGRFDRRLRCPSCRDLHVLNVIPTSD